MQISTMSDLQMHLCRLDVYQHLFVSFESPIFKKITDVIYSDHSQILPPALAQYFHVSERGVSSYLRMGLSPK